jgi:CheY-like chemotaxis protein
MPRLGGYETLHEINNDAELSGIPVLMMVNRTDPTVRERCLSLRATELLEKPSPFREWWPQSRLHVLMRMRRPEVHLIARCEAENVSAVPNASGT